VPRARAGADDAAASLDEGPAAAAAAREAELRREVELVEVLEPEVERSAEGAAATVAAAVAFGAGVWATLGRAKGEGARDSNPPRRARFDLSAAPLAGLFLIL
jgi:hypothetical protein